MELDEMDPGQVSGSIAGDSNSSLEPDNTLDEPVWTTVKRDVVHLLVKFWQVLIPRGGKRRDILRDWDLYGPMILTISFAFLLRENAPDGEKSHVFTGVFFILCAGSAIVTLNNQLLGGTMSIFQGMCVLGYCLLPLLASCIVLKLVAYVTTHIAIRFLLVALGFAWSITATLEFVSKSSPVGRRALVVYPIVLYYVFIAWLVLNDIPAGIPGIPTTPTTVAPGHPTTAGAPTKVATTTTTTTTALPQTQAAQ